MGAKMKVLAWLGPPAAGKGTYTKLIGAMLPKMPIKITASDVIREQIALKTDAGIRMKPFLDRSEHVPADLLTLALSNKLASIASHCDSLFLDGFPRNITQAEYFMADPFIVNNVQLSCIHLNLRRSWAVIKSQGRLICPECDYSYNDAAIEEDGVIWPKDLPAIPKCSRTSGCGYDRLERRADQNAFEKRFDLYERIEAPVAEMLQKKVPLRTIDILGGFDRMADPIGRAVFELLGESTANLQCALDRLPSRTGIVRTEGFDALAAQF